MTQTNHYCVPTALSILTDLPVDAVEKILKDVYLGDVEISGIYIGLALKFLSDNGYYWEPSLLEGQRLVMCHKLQHPDFQYLIEIKGHALIYKDNTLYDNSYPQGIDIQKYERRAERIVRAYRITKNA